MSKLYTLSYEVIPHPHSPDATAILCTRTEKRFPFKTKQYEVLQIVDNKDGTFSMCTDKLEIFKSLDEAVAQGLQWCLNNPVY